jgi:ketosteroid isomerase-like protein
MTSVAFALALGAVILVQQLAPDLASLVETERAFAKMSVDKGRRDAFPAFFGDDAIFFTPDPVNARRQIQTWPQAAPFKLDWEPHFGDIARSADLGYTYGKYSLEGSPRQSGYYLRVWKQRAAQWKLAIDLVVAGS